MSRHPSHSKVSSIPLGDALVTALEFAHQLSRPHNVQPNHPISAKGISLRQPYLAEELLRDFLVTRPLVGQGVKSGSNGSATVDFPSLGDNHALIILDNKRPTPFGLTAPETSGHDA